jgi:PAS domain S-box-containing protein
MEIGPSIVHRSLAFFICVAGLVVAWIAFEPAGLLVAVAALCIWLGWQEGLGSIALTGGFWAGIVFWNMPLGQDSMIQLGVYLGAATAIWLLVQMFRTSSLYDVLDQDSRRLVAEIPGLGWTAYPDGRIRFVNPAVLAFIGVTPEAMRKMIETEPNALEQWTHPDDRDRNRTNWDHALKTGEPLIDEQRVLRCDGVYRWFRDTVVPSRDKRGRITGWYGHTTDITDQKNAEEALRASERELRLLVDTVPTMIFLLTPEALPYYFNKRFLDWAGIEPDSETADGSRDHNTHTGMIHPDDRAGVAAAFRRSIATGEPLQYKGRLRRKDGQFRWIDSRVEPLRDESGTILRWYGVNIDIDDEVRAQEALRLADERLARASRAASLSELSVSIAHELNSPLQAVVANANAYQRWLNADPPNYERAGRTAEKIIRDANAAAEVVGRIRALFAQTTPGRSPVDLNGVISEVTELVIDRLVSGNVRLGLTLDPALPLVSADRVQVEQVVLNLIRNAIEAMQSTSPGERRLQIVSRRRDDDTLEVEVGDRGPGIPDPERIFEAFYTTKTDGMGMGLAICRSIIEAHGGRITARSTAGRGSTVSFTLPLAGSEPDTRIGQ